MNMTDLYSKVSVKTLIEAAVLAADNTPASLDLRGYQSAIIALDVGAGGITFDTTNKIEFVLTHSDDDVTYINATANDVQGPATVTNGIVKSLVAAHASPTLDKIGYVGGKRFIKFKADFSGTHGTGTAIAAIAVLGDPRLSPAA